MESMPIPMIKLVLYGFLTWLIPLVVSVPQMGRDGEPTLPTDVFESLMIVAGLAAGAWLLVRAFGKRPAFKRAELFVGRPWFGIDVGVDLLILVPPTKMSLVDYVGDLGLRCHVIPVTALSIGVASSASNADS